MQHDHRILNTIPLFLSRIYKMVDDPLNHHILSWNDPCGFYINSLASFKSEILPKYFRHQNFSSFARQLNMYGFKRRTFEDGSLSFIHEYFQKDNMQIQGQNSSLLQHIQRKKSKNELPTISQKPYENPDWQRLLKQINSYKKKNQKLEGMIQLIAQQNKEALKQNQQLRRRLIAIMDESILKAIEGLNSLDQLICLTQNRIDII